ncbi:retrotransposon-related protein [Tanacetum coccineum]
MVQPETQVGTHLQIRINAQDEKIELLSTQMKELSETVISMKEVLNELPKSLEKVMSGYQKQQEKRPFPRFSDDGSPFIGTVDDDASASGVKFTQGIDPRGWITRAELYYQVHKTPLDKQLNLVQVCMDGPTLKWYTNLMIKHPNTTWDLFKDKLMVRFSGTKFRNAHEALGSLYQDEGVDEYIEEFKALSALILNQYEEQSIGMFLRGLKNDIRSWVRTLNPLTCDQAMEFARNVEIATTLNESKSGTRAKSGPLLGIKEYYQTQSWKNSPREIGSRPDKTIQSYSSFGACGQKYSPQHKCSEGTLRILLLAEGEELDDNGEIQLAEAILDEEEADGECLALELNGYPTISSSNLKTIKLAGELNGIPILILIDSGATHNFISKKLAIALGLTIKPVKRLQISLGDDSWVWIGEQCYSVSVGSFNS